MNQILSSKETIVEDSLSKTFGKKAKFNFFKFQFVFCLFFSILVSGYYFYLQYDKKQKEALSEKILDRFSITSLYENNESNYSSLRASSEYQTDSFGFSVIGLIEIDTIGIYYPIINEFSYELLKIAPCKFFGPNPNEIR
ncbi:MAG: hypothetical protein J6A04_07255 [Clostridia bacterium]|nr:hypothetical protein [Clostridia bacterium]